MGITRSQMESAARDLIRLSQRYKTGKEREGTLDGLVFGYLEARFGKMQRQYAVKTGRIDFRHGTSNPCVIEFAVRTKGAGQHYGSQNRPELLKLAKFINAKTRFLLLLDISNGKPTPRAVLKASYDKEHAGVGKFRRHYVTVVYAHPQSTYSFRWNPYS